MKKIWKKEKKNILIGIISLIALVIGASYISFIPTLLIILIIDFMILFFTRKKSSPKEKWQSFLIVCFCCFIFALLSGLVFGLFIAISSPSFTPEKLYNKEATIIYDKTGAEVTKLGTEERKAITYDEASESLIDAIIATEDARFFQHSGVDIARFLKASATQVLRRGGGGASTITMQVVKNTFTDTTDSGIKGIIRKFTDIYMSVFKIEPKYTKEEILEFYMNSNCMGGNIYGVEQASLAYFNKNASDLNVAEAAMIAGLFQAPNSYSPYKNPEACEKRRKVVLGLMLRHGYINQEEYDIALQLTVDKLLTSSYDTVSSEYQAFIDTVVDEVITRTKKDPYSVPMKIYTTLDTAMQKNIDGIMSSNTYKWKNDVVQAGAVIIDVNNGEVNAVGAGHNRKAGDWNYATMNKRQIGSTAKPLFDYGPSIEYNNWSTENVVTDEPYGYSDGKSLRNFDSNFKGYLHAHDALKYSRNIPALKTFQQIENKKIKEFVTNLGLSPEVVDGKLYETHSIGGYNGESPLTVAAAYAAFSNGGYYNEPHSFTKVIFSDSGEDYVVKPIVRRAMSEATAYMITTILEDTSSYAVGLSVNGVNYCAKTGTTDLSSEDKSAHGLPGSAISDKWIASYNDSYAIGIWYGYKELNKENYLTSSDGSVKTLFQAIAKGVYKEKSEWTMPDSVVQVDVEDGLNELLLPSEFTPSDLILKAYFRKGFEPTETSNRFAKLGNVTNLKYDDTSKKLTWTGIDTPKYLNNDTISSIANIFTDAEYKNNYITSFKNYNSNHIGNVVYKVYKKDSAGNLTLVGTTSDTSLVCQASGSTTFVVKSSYSVLTNNMSDGTELSVTASSNIITSELNSTNVIELNVGETYTEPTKPVIVLENNIDVTNQATITTSVKKASNNQVYDSTVYINGLSIETYTITYNVSYNGYTNTLTKTVTIK